MVSANLSTTFEIIFDFHLPEVSDECLNGNPNSCYEENCDQSLPQYVGSILTDNKNTNIFEGDERIFVCDPGFVRNPALKEGSVNIVRFLKYFDI